VFISVYLRPMILAAAGGRAVHRGKHLVEIVLVMLILGLAFFLRVRRLDTTGVWADQALTLTTAMQWVNGGAMPLAANKSSAGFMNPPMIEYLFAAALLVWPDILSVALMTLVSGMVAVAATGWATYRVFGRRAALWAMALFAVNPWGVLYSQLIWNQTLVPVFASLMAACLLLYFAVEQRPLYLILSFVWAAFMTQVHPGTVVQLATMALICAIFWRKLKLWPLLVGGAIFALSYVPFLLYESGVGWADVKTALDLAGGPAPVSPAAVLLSIDLLRAQGLSRAVAGVVPFDTLAAILLALSLGYAVWAGGRALARRREDEEAARWATGLVILLLWFALPILFYLRSAHYLQIYYLIGQWPAHFILIGVCVAGLQRAAEHLVRRVGRRTMRADSTSPRAPQIAAWAVLGLPVLALIVWQAWFNLQYQDRRFQAHKGHTQIRHVRAAIQAARRLLAERPACDLVVVSEGHHLEASELSLMREFASPEREFVSPECILLADGDLAVPLPDPCAVYLDALPRSRASAWLEDGAAPLPGTEIDVLGERWRFYDLPAGDRADLVRELAPGAPLAMWANGVALMRYERGEVRPGGVLPLTLAWTVEAQPPEVVYHFGTYLLAMDNQVIAQSDGPGFDSIQWRAGDAFVTWFEIAVPEDLPPGEYRVAMALYTWPALERIDLTSGGNTAFLERLVMEE
jgi:hypothetical protein